MQDDPARGVGVPHHPPRLRVDEVDVAVLVVVLGVFLMLPRIATVGRVDDLEVPRDGPTRVRVDEGDAVDVANTRSAEKGSE